MLKLNFSTINRTTESRILTFLNQSDAKSIDSGVVDDPSKGTIGLGYDIGIKVAQRIIKRRNSLNEQQFTSILQLDDIKGLGQDKLNDLIYSFRQVGPSSKLISIENRELVFKAIQDAVAADQRPSVELAVNRLFHQANMIENLAKDAVDFIRGDSHAGYRMLQQLNFIQSGVPNSGNQSEEPVIQPISGGPQNFPFPDFPGLRFPCFFNPKRFGEIFFGIQRLKDLVVNPPDEFINIYLRGVDHMINRLAPLEMLYTGARSLVEGVQLEPEYFQNLTNWIQSPSGNVEWPQNIQPISSGDGASPLPIPRNLPLIFDPCRLERWQETADAVTCFRGMNELPPYEITDIFNVTKGASRRGCEGDEIEIRGQYLGNRGEVTIGRADAEILSWSNTSIRFLAPVFSAADNIGLCINPDIAACVRFPFACKPAAPGTDRSFELVPAPQIESYSISGVTLTALGANNYEAEACSRVQLMGEARRVEQVRIIDSNDVVVFDSGEGALRTIVFGTADSPIAFDNIEDDISYTLEAINLCGTVSRTINLEVYKQVRIIAPSRLRVGESAEVPIRISCPAPVLGQIVRLTSSQPGSLPIIDEVVIPEGETSVRHTITSASPCAEVRLDGASDGHRPGSATVLIFDQPVITNVTPVSIPSCEPFSIEIQGDCFDPIEAGNAVFFSSDSVRIPLTIEGIRFLNADNRGRDAIISVTGRDLIPGNYQVEVQSHGLTSLPFSTGIIVNPVPPIIHSFTSSATRVIPCSSAPITFNWEVSRASRVELLNGSEVVESQNYAASCSRRTGSFNVDVSSATEFTLRVRGLAGSGTQERNIRIEELAVPQASRITLFNGTNDSPRFTSTDLTIWEMNGTTGRNTNHGNISPGEQESVELQNCNTHAFIAVSHFYINRHNRSHGSIFRPDDPAILAYSQFFKYSIGYHDSAILGRDSAAPFVWRISPGD